MIVWHLDVDSSHPRFVQESKGYTVRILKWSHVPLLISFFAGSFFLYSWGLYQQVGNLIFQPQRLFVKISDFYLFMYIFLFFFIINLFLFFHLVQSSYILSEPWLLGFIEAEATISYSFRLNKPIFEISQSRPLRVLILG